MAPIAENDVAHTNGNGTNGTKSSTLFTNGVDGINGSHSLSASSSSIDIENNDSIPLHNRFNRNQYPKDHSHRIDSFGVHEAEAGGPRSKANAKIDSYKDDPHNKTFPRISKPVELMRNTYDTVVIGSGYGGGVAASRMARAGHGVCLLELGKERWPGEYPSGVTDAVEQLHVSGDFAPGWLKGKSIDAGDPTGLYHLILGKGQNAFVGNGLGGTSLLNANIFLEATDDVMAMDVWPEELRQQGALKKYYKRAAHVLQPKPYPDDWPQLHKLTMLERQAKALGFGPNFYRPPQTTRFVNGPNSTGVEMYPSALTGMDSTGVNDGSKSSTLVNYLSDAWNWGAEMFCECEVRYIKKHPDPKVEGYLVFYAWHGSKRGAFKTNLYEDLMWVHAKKCVFLGAGSIGTTEILLRSKSLGLSMSDKVGLNMSGNGDILAFGYNCDKEVNAIGRSFPSPYNPIGPTISGVIDCRYGHENPLDGFVIEEGAVPKALAPLFQVMLESMPGNQAPKGVTLFNKVQHVLAQQGSRFLGPYFKKGSIEKTQVYLIMSHDTNQAILSLKNDKPVLEFLGVGRSDHVQYLNGLLKQATEAVGGTFVQNPFYAALGEQEITVHPIGGAYMSSNGTGDLGVTNHAGEVFTGQGEETYPGLVVTDAGVIPTALGVNPFATITALAERSVELTANKLGLAINTQPNSVLDLFGEPEYTPEKRAILEKEELVQVEEVAKATALIKETEEAKMSGFGFTEVMSGFIHIGSNQLYDEKADFETAAKTARGLCEAARFFLSVKTWDTERLINREDHSAMLTGTFACAALPGSPFLIQRGDFNLFRKDLLAPGTRNLTYDFDMTSVKGEQYHFHGYKIVDSSVTLSPVRFWNATSTLYVTISKPSDSSVLGVGILHIKPMDFLSECLTLEPYGKTLISKLASATSFAKFFVKQSASLFFSPFTYLQYPAITYSGYINDTLPDETIQIVASDGVQTILHKWNSVNPTVERKTLFMVPGAAVDHQIYALPTIETNAVNYFTRAGYDVYVTVHRICMLMVAENNWTTYDSRLDFRACLEWIRAEQKSEESIYTIAHCMGSVAFSCGLLDGTIPAHWIKGISCSQVFMNPIWAPLNMAKVKIGPISFDRLYKMTGGNWWSCSSSTEDSLFQRAVSQVLRFYPDTRLWNHRNLNEATHRQINRFFGGVNMTLLHLLMQMGHRGFVTSNAPLFNNLTTPANVRRLKGIPIFLFSGSENHVLTPAATNRTYEILTDTFGADNYGRREVPGYGHLDCWMGREAYKDVYPMVREQVDRVCRGEGYKYVELSKEELANARKLAAANDRR
ncbi:hypothetical protein B7463_g5567, partial [Scytalidium lignicola]